MAKKKAKRKTAAKRKTVAKRKSTTAKRKSPAKRKSAAKRERLAPPGDSRFIRRDEAGRIEESDDQGRSQSVDRRRKARGKAKRGQGDRGDR